MRGAGGAAWPFPDRTTAASPIAGFIGYDAFVSTPTLPTTAEHRAIDAIRRACPLFEHVSKATHLLDSLQWPRAVEERFFAAGAKELPVVEYEIDRERARKNAIEVDQLAMTLDVADPVQKWLASVGRSYADANRMLLAVGTPRFHALSVDVYGGPRSWFDEDTTNLELAVHLDQRLFGQKNRALGEHEQSKLLSDQEFAQEMEERAKKIDLPIEVSLDEDLSAKVVAGSTRVRVRKGATFKPWEVRGLFVHEVETHALTAQNGAAQPELTFLKSGGPRTTRTQEGLAVFSEFWAHALNVERMRRVVRRVRLVAAAEDGADFLELYRQLLEEGASERDAYLDAQRICRGGLVTGKAPFTKDASYLAGFTEVFNFLQVAVRGGARKAVSLLACGRIALDDLAILHELERRGILHKPKHTPHWIAAWDDLLPYFAFVSFLEEIDLAHVAKRHAEILAATQTPFS